MGKYKTHEHIQRITIVYGSLQHLWQALSHPSTTLEMINPLKGIGVNWLHLAIYGLTYIFNF